MKIAFCGSAMSQAESAATVSERFACGCPANLEPSPRESDDPPLTVSEGELAAIRAQLDITERMLTPLFGEVYCRSKPCLEARQRAAALIDRHFDGILEEWLTANEEIFGLDPGVIEEREMFRASLRNALVRFNRHLRDPDDIETYVYLRRHCQEGIFARARTAEFNAIHIALKQAILRHLRAELSGPEVPIMVDTVVAMIDERRMMVSSFYIESREHALRASEEKYRNSIDKAPDPVFEVESETGVILAVNSAAVELTKKIFEQGVVGRSIFEIAPIKARARRHLEAVLRYGSDQVYDLPLAGRYFDINSALIPFGGKHFVQMILRDVTQRREMLDELLKAERLAAAGTFAAGVAHEVNNPLASISSLVQTLLDGESEPAQRMMLHTILSQITRISDTLRNLVDFARPAATYRRRVELNSVVTETLRLLAYNKRFRGIAIETQLASDLKPVFANEDEVQQVLLNLLFNAADAVSGENGRIQVVTYNDASERASDRGERVVLQIIDNGVGISKENLERVFDPFFTTKPAGSGVGLGLSLCQRIILSNRGTIRVASEVGAGTTITITLPPFDESAAEEADKEATEAR